MAECFDCGYPLPEWYPISCPQCARNASGVEPVKEEVIVAPVNHTPYNVSDREARIRKHLGRLVSANEMLADGRISQVERDGIRSRMLQIIEDPNA